MEYRTLKPGDADYPARLRERLGAEAPTLYAHGPLEHLSRWTLAVLGGDAAGTMLELWRVMPTVVQYEIHYISGFHSPLETHTFLAGIESASAKLTLVSVRGLQTVSAQTLLDERYGENCEKRFLPLVQAPEYYRRFREGELLILSVTDPAQRRLTYRDIMRRNWICCNLADLVFIPYARKVEQLRTRVRWYKPRPSKTFRIARRVLKAGIPAFTLESHRSVELVELGIPAFNPKTVGAFLESHGAKPYRGAPLAQILHERESREAQARLDRRTAEMLAKAKKAKRQPGRPAQLELWPARPTAKKG